MFLPRRKFLALAGISAASMVGAAPLKTLYARVVRRESIADPGYGRLVPDPDRILDLPEGFSYRIVSRAGETMGDGTSLPGAFDGMAAFGGDAGKTILIRNHELTPGQTPGIQAPGEYKYDRSCRGGTTTLIVDRDGTLIEEFVSLAGTNRNCGGGKTLHGTWISSEEDTSSPGSHSPENPERVTAKHGYNFEVSPVGRIVKPVPLVAMGRFRHEAIAADPRSGYIYQTEDRQDGCFYRFRPKEPRNPRAGGVLEALAIESTPGRDTVREYPTGRLEKVRWLRIEEVDPEEDTLRYEARGKGAAIFTRGEGICFGDGSIYWTCTDGGRAGKGQIFRYDPATETMELFVESPGEGVLDYPDNLTLSPFGDLIVCEDGGGEQFLVGITPRGRCYHLARNALNNSEFAGVCFSPDGRTMFVNRPVGK